MPPTPFSAPRSATLTLYVPAAGAAFGAMVLPGSAIVGSPDGDRIRIDYEGNRYRSANLVTFADRARQAAGRHLERYPTIARAWVAPANLVVVGTYEYPGGPLSITDPAALARWLGLTDLPASELRYSSL